jgi:hypothetical protein
VRLIAKEMPHLTANEVAQFCEVRSELLYLEAAEYFASANASVRIGEIIREIGAVNLMAASEILVERAGGGDERARKLLDQLDQAFLCLGLVEE